MIQNKNFNSTDNHNVISEMYIVEHTSDMKDLIKFNFFKTIFSISTNIVIITIITSCFSTM